MYCFQIKYLILIRFMETILRFIKYECKILQDGKTFKFNVVHLFIDKVNLIIQFLI